MLERLEHTRHMRALALLLFGACAAPEEGPDPSAGWGPFVHIARPNPVMTPLEGAWDSWILETSDAFKEGDTYYLYYHAAGEVSYQLGVATAKHPLGPFERFGDAPVLTLGPEGSWDDSMVACAMILKEAEGRWLMWYSGYGSGEETSLWSVGLATAPGPTGPWTKHEGNPIVRDFGYVGGVVKVDGEYRLYVAHPIGSTGPDYSPMSLATATSPEGPWKKHAENPVLREGAEGEWDHGGFSEAEVLYADGLHHMFYGGATLMEPRIRTRESVGYAFSADGVHFTRSPFNPVADLDDVPNASAFAEVHAIHEPPFVFLYHTLRYEKAWREGDEDRMPMVEDVGVQALVMERPFKLEVPLLAVDKLRGMCPTSLTDCDVICLEGCDSLDIHLSGTYSKRASAGLRVALRTSQDGLHFDAADDQAWNLPGVPTEALDLTVTAALSAPFMKVVVTNLEGAAIEGLRVTATLGG